MFFYILTGTFLECGKEYDLNSLNIKALSDNEGELITIWGEMRTCQILYTYGITIRDNEMSLVKRYFAKTKTPFMGFVSPVAEYLGLV